jgi:hypothetical protein
MNGLQPSPTKIGPLPDALKPAFTALERTGTGGGFMAFQLVRPPVRRALSAVSHELQKPMSDLQVTSLSLRVAGS